MTPARLRAELERPWRHGEHIDARGIVLGDVLDLSGATVRGFDLGGARVPAIDARGARLRGLAWLTGARVAGTVDFQDVTTRSDLRADGLTCDVLDLRGARIEGVLRLEDAKIRLVRLDGAMLMANLSLDRAKVGSLEMRRAAILGGVCAIRATIGRVDDDSCDVEGRRLGQYIT